MINTDFKLDGSISEMDFYGTFFRLLRFAHNKNLKSSSNINGGSNSGKKIRCAKPTIRRKNTVEILSKNGKKISLDILDLTYLDMQNGHKFITGKVSEKNQKVAL